MRPMQQPAGMASSASSDASGSAATEHFLVYGYKVCAYGCKWCLNVAQQNGLGQSVQSVPACSSDTRWFPAPRLLLCRLCHVASATGELQSECTPEFHMLLPPVPSLTPCCPARAHRHDWSVCPFAHTGEMAARRDPSRYIPIFCFHSKQVRCRSRSRTAFILCAQLFSSSAAYSALRPLVVHGRRSVCNCTQLPACAPVPARKDLLTGSDSQTFHLCQQQPCPMGSKPTRMLIRAVNHQPLRTA